MQVWCLGPREWAEIPLLKLRFELKKTLAGEHYVYVNGLEV